MKKIVTKFTVENVSIETVRGRKAIVSELLRTKQTLSKEDRDQLKRLQTAQKNLAKLKTQRRKTKSYYAKKSLNDKIKKREMYVQRMFNKTFGVKYDKKTKTYTQRESGKKVARFTKRGTYQVQAKKLIRLTSFHKQQQTTGEITTYEMFEYNYRMKRDIRETLAEYGVLAHFSQFTGGTSAAWTRRVMNACGVSDTVDENTFYWWLIDAGIGGTR